MDKARILLMTTGGTLASRASDCGLRPALGPAAIRPYLRPFEQRYSIEYRDILSLDSSNIQPEDWQYMARCIAEAAGSYEGLVLTHGTDTMAYTASALSYMLRDLDRPVVLTGSQVPLEDPLSDAPANLALALTMAASGRAGVFVAFDRRVMLGVRAVKTHTRNFRAFDSINAEPVARLSGEGLVFHPHWTQIAEQSQNCRGLNLQADLCTDVFLLKLIPGLNPRIFRQLQDMGYRGLVIEAFGIGGLHLLHRDHVSALGELIAGGLPVVITSQCLYEQSDFSLYETGRRLKALGAIEAFDMTSEAAVTKLMWLLAQDPDPKAIARGFARSYCGEISLPN